MSVGVCVFVCVYVPSDAFSLAVSQALRSHDQFPGLLLVHGRSASTLELKRCGRNLSTIELKRQHNHRCYNPNTTSCPTIPPPRILLGIKILQQFELPPLQQPYHPYSTTTTTTPPPLQMPPTQTTPSHHHQTTNHCSAVHWCIIDKDNKPFIKSLGQQTPVTQNSKDYQKG